MNTKQYTVCVTGVGAVIGYGLIQSLRACSRSVRVIGIDIYHDAYGRFLADTFYQVPYTASPEYFPFLCNVLEREGVDLLIPGIEPDAFYLSSQEKELDKLKVHLVTNNSEIMSFSSDKWLTYEKLQAAGVLTIPTVKAAHFQEAEAICGLPLLLKLRSSSAGKGMVKANDKMDFQYWTERHPGQYIAQKIVGKDSEEFTVGAFGFGDGTCCEPIIFRRILSREGSTAKACFEQHPQLAEFTKHLCSLFQPIGPTNFQYRCDKHQIYLLEINPRVSSSSSIRTLFGYNEAEMCLDWFVDEKKPSWVPKHEGRQVVRYLADYMTPTRFS